MKFISTVTGLFSKHLAKITIALFIANIGLTLGLRHYYNAHIKSELECDNRFKAYTIQAQQQRAEALRIAQEQAESEYERIRQGYTQALNELALKRPDEQAEVRETVRIIYESQDNCISQPIPADVLERLHNH